MWVYAAVAVLLCLNVGCSGIRVGAEITRVDSFESTSAMKPLPWKCYFIDCSEVSNAS